jgi:hypothetical protein
MMQFIKRKNNQNGFIQPAVLVFTAVAVVFLIIIGVARYSYFFNNNSNDLTPTPTPILSTPTSSEVVTPTPPLADIEATLKPKPTIIPILLPTPSPVGGLTPTPIPTITPTSTIISENSLLSVNMRSIVGLYCKYTDASGNEQIFRGSGVIIDKSGIILTNRHIALPEGLPLKYCHVSIPSIGVEQTTINKIKDFNILDEQTGNNAVYIADTFYIPKDSNLSEIETKYLDFALLKIDKTLNDVSHNEGMTYVIPFPIDFPYTPIKRFIKEPNIKDTIVSFGYEAKQVSAGFSFDIMRLQGYVGIINDIFVGDEYLSNTVLAIDAEMKSISGVSGSPVFFPDGSLIGLRWGSAESVADGWFYRQSAIVAIEAIIKILGENGYSYLLK